MPGPVKGGLPHAGAAEACTFRLTASCVGSHRVAAASDKYRPSGPSTPADAVADAVLEKNVDRAAIAAWRASPEAPKLGCAVAPAAEGGLAMDTRSLDRLVDEIAELSAHLDAATARLLELIREFDARGGWNTGFRSCAAWLSWRGGLDLGGARGRVRGARGLETPPLLAGALAPGERSYAKVRALTRVATRETETRLLGVGRAGTAAHVERIVRSWRWVDRQG